jgi:ferrochelatase
VLLVNLGTPSQPDTPSVRFFLKQFLSDPRVIDYPPWLWSIILNFAILPIRSRKVSKLYQQIWLHEGSPLRVITLRQAQALQTKLSADAGAEIVVEVAMTYGSPSLQYGLDQLLSKGVERIVVLPLYPQYSATTTAAAFDGINELLRDVRNLPQLRWIKNYAHESSYINVLAQSIRRDREQREEKADLLLFSFHGLPERYIKLGDPYQAECEATAKQTATALGLADDQWRISYQSRVGKEKWIGPYTEATLRQFPKEGVKSIDVVCPAFACDCLETLEEIAVENKAVFLSAGGQHYHYIKALNDDQEHIDMLAGLIDRQLLGW